MRELRVTMSDGTVWAIPVRYIALHRARYYMDEYNNDLDKSLAQDTYPLFTDDFEIIDWACNNMNWDDVKDVARKVITHDVDYQEGWLNGAHEIVRMS